MRNTPFGPGEFYHFFNRANSQQDPLFFQERNYRYFMQKWAEYLEAYFEVWSYCLIPNHFHFLLRVTPDANADCMEQWRRFAIAYTQSITDVTQTKRLPVLKGRAVVSRGCDGVGSGAEKTEAGLGGDMLRVKQGLGGCVTSVNQQTRKSKRELVPRASQTFAGHFQFPLNGPHSLHPPQSHPSRHSQ